MNNDLLPEEFSDIELIIKSGAEKYGMDNWLEPDGKNADHKSMHNSMFHHLSDSWAHKRQDHESGLDPLLHLACRALMCYTRLQRQIKHKEDSI